MHGVDKISKYIAESTSSTSPYDHIQENSSDSGTDIISLKEDCSNQVTRLEGLQHKTTKISGRKIFINPKLVAALDRWHISIRDNVYVLEATIEALG